MQARQLSFGHGAIWLLEGLRLWRRNPALLTFAAFTYLLLIVLVSSLPLLGQPVAFLIMPALSLGVVNTCRAIDEGRKAGPDILFSGFKQNLPALVTVGGIYLVGNLLVLAGTSLFDDGLLVKLMSGAVQLDPESDEVPELATSLIAATLLSTPVVMAYWFAPVLSGWYAVSAPKAMFFSFVSCLRNWRPFLAFAIAMMLFYGLLPGVVIGVLGLVSPFLSTLVLLLLPMLLVPVLFASFYINIRDVFGDGRRDDAPGDEPQAS
jgi:hypothetical protein